ARVQAEICPPKVQAGRSTRFHWSLKVDRVGFLDALEDGDLADVEEVIVDVARDHPAVLAERLRHWDEHLGREHIRLALPALTRQWEDGGLRHKIDRLRGEGWLKWEAANLSAWQYLGVDPEDPAASGLDLATDWSVYVVNRLAAEQVLRMGAS